jgi:hypothetical protein
VEHKHSCLCAQRVSNPPLARYHHISGVKTPLGAQTEKSVFHCRAKQFGGMSSRFDWLPRNRFAADARNQNGAAPPNAARPGEFAGQNSEAKWDDDNCGSRQNNHHQPDQYNAEANRADEKSAQARPRFEPETRNPFLKPTIHKKASLGYDTVTFDRALSRDEIR